MSFRCQSQSGAIAKAVQTVGLSGTAFTIAGWFRRESAATINGSIIMAGTNGNNNRLQMETTANGGDVRFKNTNGFDGTDSVFTVADGEWIYGAISCSGATYNAWGWRDTTAEDRTQLAAVSYTSITPDKYIIGGDSNVNPYWVPARGEYVHVRYWNAALNETELNAERKSATAVRTANLVGDHPLASSTDNSDASGNGRTLTITGTTDLATGSSYPTSIGSGASAVINKLFGPLGGPFHKLI